jgi:hypothetical protein
VWCIAVLHLIGVPAVRPWSLDAWRAKKTTCTTSPGERARLLTRKRDALAFLLRSNVGNAAFDFGQPLAEQALGLVRLRAGWREKFGLEALPV